MSNNQNKLIELRTQLKFYKKLDSKIDDVLNGVLEIEDWSGEVYDKIKKLEVDLDNLKIEMDLPDEEFGDE